jgi:hypothetical protein
VDEEIRSLRQFRRFALRAAIWNSILEPKTLASLQYCRDSSVALNQASRTFQRQRGERSDALPFERLVPAFDLTVRLWIGRR